VYLALAVAIVVVIRPVVPEQMLLLLAGAAAFGVIGLIDDVRDVGAWKLAAEGAVATAIVLVGGVTAHLPWPHAGQFLTILWIVGVANAWNCLDSTDGAAAGAAVIGALALVPVALVFHHWDVAVGAAALAGAASGFLRYNFPPARIFLGDAGSLMLGFLLAAYAAMLATPARGTALWDVIAPLLILGLPAGDFVFVHWRRYQNGVRNPLRILTSTGKDHLPHRLLDSGFSARHAAFWIYGVSALLGGSAVMLVVSGPFTAMVLVVLFVAGTSVLRNTGIGHPVHEGFGWQQPSGRGEVLVRPESTAKT
jgi:UDP-GlcNAc:undecaprenyl-phosphate GlcNAc-1-phosphate transferase